MNLGQDNPGPMEPGRARLRPALLPALAAAVAASALAIGAASCAHKKAKERPRAAAAPAAPKALSSEVDPFAFSQDETRELMEAVCEPAPLAGTPAQPICDTCPVGTTFAGETAELSWRGAIRGAFSGAGREALIHTEGCEPHSGSFGGSFLVRYDESDEQWHRVSYHGGFLPSACLKVPAREGGDGRESLVCEVQWAGQGLLVVSLIAVEFPGGKRVEQALTDYGNNLGDEAIGTKPPYLITRESWRVEAAAPGQPRLVVKLRVRKARKRGRAAAAAATGSPAPGARNDAEKLLGRGETVTLRWLRAKDGSYQPDRATKKALRRLQGVTVPRG